MVTATIVKSMASAGLPESAAKGIEYCGTGRSSYAIQLATSISLGRLVFTSRECSMTGRRLSSTGLPMGFGQRTVGTVEGSLCKVGAWDWRSAELPAQA